MSNVYTGVRAVIKVRMEQSVWTAIFTECNRNKYACCDVNKWAFIAQSSQSLLVKRAPIKPDRWEVQLKINAVWILNGIKVQQSTVTVRCVGRTNCNCIQAENVGAVVKKESRAWGSIYATREFAELFYSNNRWGKWTNDWVNTWFTKPKNLWSKLHIYIFNCWPMMLW